MIISIVSSPSRGGGEGGGGECGGDESGGSTGGGGEDGGGTGGGGEGGGGLQSSQISAVLGWGGTSRCWEEASCRSLFFDAHLFR